ncbi:MAG: hypothetical protein Q7K65_03705 [Candidatus Buchananbacteria bacterium]|nr:hypothetical protein [Candidatus Buchananbacteria bacterium]
MSFKTLAGLFFLILVFFILAVSYYNSSSAKTDLATISSNNGQPDLLDMTPLETYRLTVKNTMPEIKILGCLLLLVAIVAVLAARFEMFSPFTRNILNQSLKSMVSNRSEKLSVLREKQRIEDSWKMTDKKAIENVIEELEKSIKARNGRNP